MITTNFLKSFVLGLFSILIANLAHGVPIGVVPVLPGQTVTPGLVAGGIAPAQAPQTAEFGYVTVANPEPVPMVAVTTAFSYEPSGTVDFLYQIINRDVSGTQFLSMTIPTFDPHVLSYVGYFGPSGSTLIPGHTFGWGQVNSAFTLPAFVDGGVVPTSASSSLVLLAGNEFGADFGQNVTFNFMLPPGEASRVLILATNEPNQPNVADGGVSVSAMPPGNSFEIIAYQPPFAQVPDSGASTLALFTVAIAALAAYKNHGQWVGAATVTHLL